MYRCQKLFYVVDGHEKTDFSVLQPFWLRPFFWSMISKKMTKKWPEPKKLLIPKISFFMPVNHEKEFLKSVHNEVLFWQLFARPLIQLSSTIFKANFLKMVSINSEFLVVSMVNTAPESLTKYLLYCICQIEIIEKSVKTSASPERVRCSWFPEGCWTRG